MPASGGDPRQEGVSPAALAAGDTPPEAHDHGFPAHPSKPMEIACGAFAVLVSIVLVWQARAVEVRAETGGIDPRWWPELLGLVGTALGAFLLVRAVVRPALERDDVQEATHQGRVRAVVAIVLSALYVATWPVVGFLVVTPVFLVAATYLFGGRGWRTLVLFPAGMTAFIYLLFVTALKVPL